MSLRLVFLGLAVAIAAPPALAAQNPPSGGGNIGPLCQTGCTPQYSVDVTPDGGWDPDRPQNSSGHVTTFTATNTGSSSQTFAFECWGTGGVTCTNVTPGSKKLLAGQSQVLTVTYSVGSSGGEIRASAEAISYDEGFKNVSTPPNLTIVTPRVTHSPDTALVHTRTPLVLATYFSNDAPIDTTSLVVKLGADTVTALTRRNARLVEWEVDVSRQLSPGVSRDLYVRVCNTNGGCSAITRRLVLDNSGAPIVSFAGMPLEALGRQFTAPFGPGLAVAGAEVETGFSTPSYLSMNAARSAGLVYSTRQSYPRALVNADIELTWPAGTPDQIKAVLIDGVVRMDSLVVGSPSCQAAAGRLCRITLQGDFSGTTYARATRKWLSVEVRVTSGGSTRTTTDSVEVVLVDRRSSVYGSGWWASAVLRLDSAGSDMVLVGPSGTAGIFRGSNGRYLSPPGDFGVLVWTGTQWELRFRDTSKLVFDAQGRHIKSTDRHNNTTTINYDGAGRVWTTWDPLGKTTTFSYDGGTGRLTTISDPGGRQTVTTIDGANQLVYDSVVGSTARTTYGYTSYGGNNTLVLSSRADALGQTTTISFDARRRPTQATLPAVLPETGSTPVSPVIGYRAQELRGLDTLLSADSIFLRVTDPRGFWTRSALDRWGAATRSWDALGTLGRAAYTAEGFVAWGEGKVADSSRINYTYDAWGRLVRSYRLRTPSDLVRLDSLVYDAGHRVIKRINPWGQRDTLIYNSLGDVLTHIRFTSGAAGDTTHFAYYSNGLVATRRSPNQTGWMVYSYDGGWNLRELQDPNGVVLATHYRDGHGREVEVRRKLTVRSGEPLPTLQWRRTRTWYTALNQVDSVRLERSTDCTAPCDYPAWPADADTARWHQVRSLYDRLGRDTARVNTRGKRTRYAYDALGRLRARWPFADSGAVVDSFRYDVAGNLRYQWTRRAQLIEHRYDSRNRDTLTVVPGVGSYRRAFAGSGDQLTRLWIEGYSDSIGGVNPELRWGYSQAGFLLADTAQGSRVTSYLYDRYGRDSVQTDPTGAWQLRYHGVRGVLDTVLTPFGETLAYSRDAWGRAVGPAVINNGADPDYAIVPGWNQVGKLISVRDSHTVTLGQWSVEGDMPDLELRPEWIERQGGGGPTVVAEDTLGHDGWGRVTAVQYLRNSAELAREELTFDRDANIRVRLESRSYDLVTTRLLVRSGDTYSYDRAGNLVSWTPSGGSTWTYSYDALERLIAVRQGGALIARYGYDGLGRRIVKRVYSGANAGYLRMLYRGGHVLAEADSAGTLTLGYTWGLATDDQVAVHRYSDGGHWYVVQDHLRSVRGLSRKDGTWVASWRYRIYGAVLDSAYSDPVPIALRYRWTGREYDAETGFYFFRSRYYDPRVQRFVQEDPIAFAGGVNLYGYGDGNPTNGRDPDGLAMDPDMYTRDPNDRIWQCMGTTAGCSGGGGGGIDWDGNGWDDFSEFTEYSWGRQLWMENGGDPAIWGKVWWGIEHNDPAVTAFMVTEVFFGNVLPLTQEALMDLAEKREVYVFGIAVTNAQRGSPWYHDWQPALTVYVNQDLDAAWPYSFAPNTIAHEASHLFRARLGRLGTSDEGGCGSEETWAALDALRATGIWARNRCN